MKKTILIGLLFFPSLLCFGQWNVNNILQMGKSAIFFDDYVEAIDKFNNIIRIKPYLPEPFFFRGVAKLSLEDFEGAVLDCAEAIKLSPNYFYAYMYRGIAYKELKRFEESIRDFEKAIELEPNNAYAYANRAIARTEMERYEEAEKDYSKALIIDDKMMFAYLNRALLRDRMKDEHGAMLDCNSAISLNSFSDDAYGVRGYLWYKRKDYFKAVDDYNRALKIKPENIKVLMSRAIALYDMKKVKEALVDYDTIIRLDSNYIFAYYNRSLIRSEIGDYNGAITDLDRVIDLNPDNILVYFNRALLKLKIEDVVGAYNDVSESIKLYPDFVRAYMVRASIREHMNESKAAFADRMKAEEIMGRYKRMKAGDVNAFVDTTASFQRLVDINASNDGIREVINGRVQDKHVIVRLKTIFFASYYPLDSIRVGNVRYYNKYTMSFNQRYNYNPAIGFANKTGKMSEELANSLIRKYSKETLADGRVNLRFLRGMIHLDKNEFPAAISDFESVAVTHPEYFLAVFNAANAKVLMYDYIEKQGGSETKVVGSKGKNRRIDYSEAMSGYEHCLSIDSSFIYALFNMATVYAKGEDIEKAIALYSRVISIDPAFAEAYFNRGLLYIYKGEKAVAGLDLSKAGELGISESYNILKRYCKMD